MALTFCAAMLVAVPALQAQISVTLTSSVTSPQPAGTTFPFTATASDSNAGNFDFQWATRPSGNGAFKVARDFHSLNTFSWTPMPYDGSYDIQVTARNHRTLQTALAVLTVRTSSRVKGTTPVLTAMASPLMVLFSAPPCNSGSSVRVRFLRSGLTSISSNVTPLVACKTGVSVNFFVAGLMPSATYGMNAEVVTGPYTAPGPPVTFTTGALPVSMPQVTILTPANSQTSITNEILLHSFVNTPNGNMFPGATDLNGNVIWYLPQATNANLEPVSLARPLSGGNQLVITNDPTISSNYLKKAQLVRELDLAGNVIGETNITRVWEQMQAMGATDIVTAFNHEAIRLPNGHTLAMMYTERIYPTGTQGSTGPVDLLGDALVDLDQNWQVAWYWSPYAHLDPNRAATLGETCSVLVPLCPQLLLSANANDWTHGNCIYYIPQDGNLLVSLRNQDWVVKIDYNNGTGTGNVLWRLGQNGDFSIVSSDPYPWFTHQHDAEYESGGNQLLSLFDNGNTRIASYPFQHSRGQALNIDETNKVATLILNADLGGFAKGMGSAELLPNGNYHYLLTWQNTPAGWASQSIEVLPTGTFNYDQQTLSVTYRSFRMSTMWAP